MPDTTLQDAQGVEAAILRRRSVRAFLPMPVPLPVVERLLTVAARAPSGSNMQPWQVDVVTGAARDKLCHAVTARAAAGDPEQPEYEFYPRQWRAPYIDRRRSAGWGLFELAGVTRGDREGSVAQRLRNYSFFDAPVGLIFSIDRDLEKGSWLDLGGFLQTIMILASARGLDTCPQASWANYGDTVRTELGIPETRLIVGGMAIGHAEPLAPVNRLETARADLSTYARFHSDDGPSSKEPIS